MFTFPHVTALLQFNLNSFLCILATHQHSSVTGNSTNSWIDSSRVTNANLGAHCTTRKCEIGAHNFSNLLYHTPLSPSRKPSFATENCTILGFTWNPGLSHYFARNQFSSAQFASIRHQNRASHLAVFILTLQLDDNGGQDDHDDNEDISLLSRTGHCKFRNYTGY